MLILLCFQCADSQSTAQINTIQKNVKLHLIPSSTLTPQEKNVCAQMYNQTAVFEVFIGGNTFRSDFIVYNPYQNYDIVLTPVGNSSTDNAVQFFIATYEITFLETTLVQQASVSELAEVYFDYRECFLDQTFAYETYSSFQVLLTTNPLCEIIADADVNYTVFQAETIMQEGLILKADFNFTNVTLPRQLCADQTDPQQCTDYTIMLSGDNFIFVNLLILIPQRMTCQDIYTDDEGNLVDITESYLYDLTFVLNINKRTAEDGCVKFSYVGFIGNNIFINQIPTGNCEFNYYRAVFWLSASADADNYGQTFQLQFDQMNHFNDRLWISCEMWKQSNFSSFQACQATVEAVQTYNNNYTTSIIYKIYDENSKYEGAYIFPSNHISGGSVIVTVSIDSLCAAFNFLAESTNLFVEIRIKITNKFDKLSYQEYLIDITDNFIYPSDDNTYCYHINLEQSDILEKLVFGDYFSEVVVNQNMGYISELITIIPYEIFWVGPLCLVLAILTGIGYTFVLQKLKKKKRASK